VISLGNYSTSYFSHPVEYFQSLSHDGTGQSTLPKKWRLQAKNSAEFKRQSKKIGVRLHADLMGKELTSSASRWGRRHLLAYRLLTHPEKPFLEILKTEHNNGPICNQGQPGSQKLDNKWTVIPTSDCSFNLKASKYYELLKEQGGFFWVALARAVRIDNVLEEESASIPEAQQHTGGERRPPKRDEYVDPTKLVIGSSPPLSQATQASGSSHSSGSDYQADSGSIPW
jgi:hypothetical protein